MPRVPKKQIFPNLVIENCVKASVPFCSSFLAPNRPPGNISWKVDGSWVTVRWDHVKSMDNESAVLGYKVSDMFMLCHISMHVYLKNNNSEKVILNHVEILFHTCEIGF